MGNTTKPTPVTIVEPKIESGEHLTAFLSGIFLLALRTTIVWGAIAILAGGLGITWIMVLIGLYALRVALPVDQRLFMSAIKTAVAEGVERRNATRLSDAELLRQRAAK